MVLRRHRRSQPSVSDSLLPPHPFSWQCPCSRSVIAGRNGPYARSTPTRGGIEEMNLQASLGVSSMQMHGQSEAARAALSRSLAIAAVPPRCPEPGRPARHAARCSTCATEISKPRCISRSSAAPLTVPGRFRAAWPWQIPFSDGHFSLSVNTMRPARSWRLPSATGPAHRGPARSISASITTFSSALASHGTCWLQGHPAQAIERVRQTIKDAERKDHPASLGLALSWAPGLFLWIGDLQSAEEHANWLLSHAETHSLRPYLAVARGYQGTLAIEQGDPRTGVEDLASCLDQLHAMRYRMLSTGFKLSLVQGLVAIGLSRTRTH